MGQRSNDAAVKDAQTLSPKVECALSTGQRSNDAAKKDAQINLSKEECAFSMEQRSNENNAVMMSAQIMLKKGDCA